MTNPIDFAKTFDIQSKMAKLADVNVTFILEELALLPATARAQVSSEIGGVIFLKAITGATCVSHRGITVDFAERTMSFDDAVFVADGQEGQMHYTADGQVYELAYCFKTKRSVFYRPSKFYVTGYNQVNSGFDAPIFNN